MKPNDNKSDPSTENEVKNTIGDVVSKIKAPETDNKSDIKEAVKPEPTAATNNEKSETDKINSTKSTDQGNVTKSESNGSAKRFVTIEFLTGILVALSQSICVFKNSYDKEILKTVPLFIWLNYNAQTVCSDN